MFVCKFCGKILEDDSRFCNGCGAMVTNPAKLSEDVPTMPLEDYDENVTLDSLIGNIDTFSVDDNSEVVTVPFTEETGDMVTMPLDYQAPEKDSTSMLVENNESGDNVESSEMEFKEFLDKNEKIRKIIVIAIIVTVAVLFFTSLIAIETNLIIPNTPQEDSTLQETREVSSVETARKEIENSLYLYKNINEVRLVYNKYVPEYYDDSEPLSEEAQVVVDELIDFYTGVYRKLEKHHFTKYEDPDDFLRQEWGNVVVDDYGGIQTIWEHGDAYAPDELVSRHKELEDLCYLIEWGDSN